MPRWELGEEDSAIDNIGMGNKIIEKLIEISKIKDVADILEAVTKEDRKTEEETNA